MPDGTLVISNDLRTISPSGPYLLGVFNDTNVHTLTFEMPRNYGPEDFGDYTISVNVKNASGLVESESVSNINVEQDTITFDWILKRFVFEKEGMVNFNVCLTNSDGTKKFHTTVYRGRVLPGLEMDDISIQSTLYRLELLLEEAEEAEGNEIVIGAASISSLQLSELIEYLNT